MDLMPSSQYQKAECVLTSLQSMLNNAHLATCYQIRRQLVQLAELMQSAHEATDPELEMKVSRGIVLAHEVTDAMLMHSHQTPNQFNEVVSIRRGDMYFIRERFTDLFLKTRQAA